MTREEELVERAFAISGGGFSVKATSLAVTALTDVLAVGLAGARDSVAISAANVVGHPFGSGPSLTWATGQRSKPAEAAFANAVACHILDWDDYSHPMHGHNSAVLLPTCSATAEVADSSGEDVIGAFLAGYEINNLLGSLVTEDHYQRGWHATSTLGVIGAAVAASVLLKLDKHQTRNAMAIAASHASGLRVNFGTATKALHPGQAARDGFLAATFASCGIEGAPDWLTAERGFMELFGAADATGAELSVDTDIGGGTLTIEGDWGLVLKPYPCCGSSHAVIDAVQSLVKQHGLSLIDIEDVEVHVDALVTNILRYAVPTTPFEARYSLPYAVASAIAFPNLGPSGFAASSIDDPKLADAMNKVRIYDDLQNPSDTKFGCRVEIRADGEKYAVTVDVAPGHPRRPMEVNRLRRKQIDALSGAVSAESAEKIIDLIQQTPSLPRWSIVTDAIEAALLESIKAFPSQDMSAESAMETSSHHWK